ncbi:MAG: cell wall-binding repeat-containing protein [Oscillospiraceae bacterium]|nr:cell wall-binding repeat-containing protein [Oscillospiraceae bacterium]
MKKILAMFVAISLLLTMAVVPGGLSAFAGDDDIVYFPDENLRSLVLQTAKFYKLDKNGDNELSVRELSFLKDLGFVKNDMNSHPDIVGVSNLEGLQYAKNLESLALIENNIDDLSPIAGLTNLKSLTLNDGAIEDISPIANLTKLKDLDLSNNNISDIATLSGLVNLKRLSLSDNSIADLTSLSDLTLIYDLKLDNNPISNLTPLSRLESITYLSLNNINTADISPLSEMNNIRELSLDNNGIEDISVCSRYDLLTLLSLNGNKISDIETLADNKELTYLYMDNNRIKDIAWLSGLTGLRILSLNNNEIRNIDSLNNLEKLHELYLSHNKISDASALPINLSFNNRHDTSGFLHTIIDLSDNYLTDFYYEFDNWTMGWYDMNISNNYIDISDGTYTKDWLDYYTNGGEHRLSSISINYDNQKPISELAELSFTRQSGSTRIETAINIAQTGWSEGAETVSLTSGRGFADALAGGSLSAALDAPLLLTSNLSTGLEDDVLNAIKDLKAKNVVILGGTGTVSTEIEAALKAQGLNVERRSGGNRYETAVDIATALYENAEFDTVFLADGNNYPDALAGAPVSGILGQPILFTNSKDKNVRDETLTFIEENGIKNVVILGGSSSVSDEVKKALEDKNIEVSRISGGNRYETALNIYNEYKDIFTGDAITITTGTNFPDALAGSAYSAKIGAPLFLLSDTLNSANIRTAITDSGRSEFLVYGGSGSLSDAAVLKHIL